jgi:hypothetical protein
MIEYLSAKLILGDKILNSGKDIFSKYFLVIFFLVLILHELIHGLTWMILLKKNYRIIKFGIKCFTPYCHCKIPMNIRCYKIGVAMPFVMLGLIPWIISLFIGNGFVFYLSLLCSLSSSIDILGLYLLYKLGNDSRVLDHPEKVGFVLLNRK